jgi:signal transduction histidine kinase
MQQMEVTTGLGGAERRRVEAVVETLATLRSHGESLAEVAHDARNMVTALGLYCDLLEEPGVLATPFLHYGNELRLVAAASRRLVEKLVALDTREVPEAVFSAEGQRELGRLPAEETAEGRLERNRLDRNQSDWPARWDLLPAEPIDNLSTELKANRNLLAALAGPSIAVTVDAERCVSPVWLTGEDLTRVLVNLVKNSAEAMPAGGYIQLRLRERATSCVAGPGKPGAIPESKPGVLLTVEDNGPGIPGKVLDKIFDSGYTTRSKGESRARGWPGTHRGLGLSITRSIIEGAGGRIHAANRSPSGARFEIELPLRNR